MSAGLQVKIARRAAAELRRAAEWWFTNRQAAPDAIESDFTAAVRLLGQQPGIGTRCDGTQVPGVRRLFLSRVGYFVYYSYDQRDLKILAFWHASREQPPAV